MLLYIIVFAVLFKSTDENKRFKTKKFQTFVTVIGKPLPVARALRALDMVPSIPQYVDYRTESNYRQCVANTGCPGRDVISNVQEMAYVVIRSCIRHNPEV